MSGQMDRPPSPEQLRKIRELSGQILDHPDRLFSEISEPETSAEASLMLGALHKVKNGLRPLAGAETAMVAMLEDVRAAEYDDGPPAVTLEKVEAIADRLEGETEPLQQTGVKFREPEDKSNSKPLRKCEACGETKRIDDFRKWGRGYKAECIACQDALGTGAPYSVNPKDEPDETEPEEAMHASDAIEDAVDELLDDASDWQKRKQELYESGVDDAYSEQLKRYLDLLYELVEKATHTYERDPLLDRIERLIGVDAA